MKKIKDEQTKNNKLLKNIGKISCVFAIFYVCIIFINQQSEVAKRKKELDEITANCQVQELKNKELEQIIENNNGDEYLESIARKDYDYVKFSERVYMSTAGN